MDKIFSKELPIMNKLDELLNLTIASPGGDYNMSLFAKYFHQIPHKDIHLNWVNSTFDLNDNQYQEALGIIVAVPGFWLILTLLFFLIFFLCRCCDVNSKKKKKLTCCKCFLFLFTLLSIGIIAVGMYGNYKTHEGMIKVQNSSSLLAQNINELHSLASKVHNGLDRDINNNLNLSLNRVTGPIMKNYTLIAKIHSSIDDMKRNTNEASLLIADIRGRLFNRTSFSQIERINVPEKEMIRTIATWAVLVSLLFIGMVLMCGVCKHSRCLLILFSVLGLLSLVICWVLTSIYVGFCVATSDLCMHPKPFVYKYLPRETNLLNYYLKCDESTSNIYAKEVNEITTHLENVNKEYDIIQTRCNDLLQCNDTIFQTIMSSIHSSMSNIRDKLEDFNQKSDCHDVHRHFRSTLNYTCKNVLEGVSLMLASSAVTGLIFTLMVLCASHTWINIRIKKKSGAAGDTNEETDPFLPPASASSTVSSSTGNLKRARDNYAAASGSTSRPRYSHTPPQTPHFNPGSGYIANAPQLPPQPSNGRSCNRDEQLSFLTAPPSYEQVGGPMAHQMHHPGHQPIAPHYVGDADMMMRGTQATKF